MFLAFSVPTKTNSKKATNRSQKVENQFLNQSLKTVTQRFVASPALMKHDQCLAASIGSLSRALC